MQQPLHLLVEHVEQLAFAGQELLLLLLQDGGLLGRGAVGVSSPAAGCPSFLAIDREPGFGPQLRPVRFRHGAAAPPDLEFGFG